MKKISLFIISFFLIASCKNKDQSSIDNTVPQETFESNNETSNENTYIKNTVSNDKSLEKKTENEDNYSGEYELIGKNDCELVILIDNNLNYEIKTNKQVQSGTIKVTKEEKDIFFLFQGFFGGDPKKEIEGKYEDGIIVIQNHGNNMNPYTRISECDSKYLHLKKKE